MFKKFYIRPLHDLTGYNFDREPCRWERDPLTHPELARMSAVELADLPAASLRAAVRE